jgi:hypothetical protein
MSLPDGFGHLAGRSRVKSIKLLAAARELGHEPGVVLTRAAGYDVPEDVLEKYLETADDDLDASATRSDAFTPVQTNHEPFALNTLHPEQAHNDDDATEVDPHPAQVGVGMEPSLAANGDEPDADEADIDSDDEDGDLPAPPADNEGDDGDDAQDPEPTPDENEDKAPAKSASKTEWLEYARSKGFEGDDDSITTKELIERFGA